MKKKVILVSIIVAILLAAGSIFVFLRQPDPQNLVTVGLQRLYETDSYCYSVTQHQWVGENDRLLTRITGEKGGENIRVLGQLAGSEVEMIKIGEVLYNKDPFTKEWVQYDGITIAQEVFLVELNPLTVLQFKEKGEVMLKGQEEINNSKCWVCTLKPSIQNQIMERFWTDFEYTLYIKKSNKTVIKADIKAVNKETKDSMVMSVEFSDIGKKILIEPPVIN